MGFSLSRIIRWGVIATLFLTPLLFSPLFRLPFATPQTVFFRVMTEMLAVIFLIDIFLKKNTVSWRALLKQPVTLFLLFFLISQGLAVIFSISPVTSFFGGENRLQGFFTFLHYGIFFFLILGILGEERNKNLFTMKMLWALSLSGAIASLFGILQKIGLDPFSPYFETQFLLGRVYGTLGNPSFLGSFLLLAMAATLLVAAKKKWAYLLLFFQVTALFLTGSRGALIGFFIEMALFFYLQSHIPFTPKVLGNAKFFRNFSLLFLLIPVFLFMGIQFLKETPLAKNPLISRMVISESTIRSVKSRFGIFENAFQIFVKRPFFGYGQETFQYAAPQNLPDERFSIKADRAHNEFLDILVASGAVSLMMYLLFLFALFWRNIQKIRFPEKGNSPLLQIGLLAGMAGYLISLQFSFATTALAMGFFTFAALSASSHGGMKFRLHSFFVVIFIVLLGFGVFGNIRFLKAEYAFAKNNFEKSVEIWPFESFYHLAYGEKLLYDKRFSEALREAEISYAINAKNPAPFILAGEIYSESGSFSFANESFALALSLSPDDIHALQSWMQSLISEKRYYDALLRGEYLLSLAPPYWQWTPADFDAASAFEKEKARLFFKDNQELKKVIENLIVISKEIGDHQREKFYIRATNNFQN